VSLLVSVIRYDDIPQLIKDYLPDSVAMVDRELADYPDLVPSYVILGQIMGPLQDTLTKGRPDHGTTKRLQSLFRLTEKVLAEGDSRSQDVFVLEVIQPLASPKLAGLALDELLGPRGRAELEAFKRWES